MSREWERTLPKELQDYIEAERQAARAAAIAELRLGAVALADAPRAARSRSRSSDTKAPSGRELRAGIGKRLPRGMGRQLVIEFWRSVATSEVLTLTQVQQLIYGRNDGANISLQTITRTMEQMKADGEIEKIQDTEGWRVVAKLRSVR